jgi:hypothetical protein
MERGIQRYAFDWDRWSLSVPSRSDHGRRIERLVLATAAVNPVPGACGAERHPCTTADPAYQLK